MWLPFYSVHFNDSKIGLRAYHLLREFSVQRQLAPPREMTSITKELLDWKRPSDPIEAEKFDETYQPRIGQLMPPNWRARAGMDQKATSVADIAAVLAIQEEEIKNGFGKPNRKYRTRNARRRRRAALEKEKLLATRRHELVAEFEREVLNNKKLYRRGHRRSYKFEIRQDTESPDSEYSVKGDEVKILWFDIYDARYAESWPERVIHGELRRTGGHIMPGAAKVKQSLVENDGENNVH